MSMATTTVDVSGITPDNFGPLIEQPVASESVAYAVSNFIGSTATRMNFPIVTDDPAVGWVAEGAEIDPDDATMEELTVTPSKVAGLTAISMELATDSSPKAAEVIGRALARDIARKVDAAFFGDTTANGPDGLVGLQGTQAIVSADAIANLDLFAEAISMAEEAGATVDTFVTNPADALTLAKLKVATDSNQPLLGTAATNALDRHVLGVPLLVSPAVAAGDVWAIPKSAVYLVQREDTTLETDRSVYFTSHRVAVRAIMRVGFGFVHPAAIVRISATSA